VPVHRRATHPADAFVAKESAVSERWLPDVSARPSGRDRATSGRFHRRTTIDDGDRARVDRVVCRARAGDREALRFLYIRFSGSVYGYVASIVHDDYEAEDITQDVFAKLTTALARYEPREVPFAAWILRVSRNVALDHMRRARPLLFEEVRPVERCADEAALDRGRALRTALAELPEDQCQVLLMRHLVGLTPGEIARRLGRSESSVHGLHHRGRRRIQRALVGLDSAPLLQCA
jgi:RNA polymerase sigma-70 factor (ECF subfamily)